MIRRPGGIVLPFIVRHLDGGGSDGYKCVQFVASPSVMHVCLSRTRSVRVGHIP